MYPAARFSRGTVAAARSAGIATAGRRDACAMSNAAADINGTNLTSAANAAAGRKRACPAGGQRRGGGCSRGLTTRGRAGTRRCRRLHCSRRGDWTYELIGAHIECSALRSGSSIPVMVRGAGTRAGVNSGARNEQVQIVRWKYIAGILRYVASPIRHLRKV